MIGFRDAITLARTKLRTKRTRLIVTVVVSGLVFGLVIAALMIFSGVAGSLERYASKQFEGKYFVSASHTLGDDTYFDVADKTQVARAKELHQKYIQKRSSAAARLGLAYDPATEDAPVDTYPGEDVETINTSSVAGKQVEDEYYAKLRKTTKQKGEAFLKKQSSTYGAEGVFELKELTVGNDNLMIDDKEVIEPTDVVDDNSFRGEWMGQGVAPIGGLEYRFADQSLLSSYLLPSSERSSKSPNAIPVVVPIDVAVEAFKKPMNLKPRPKKAEELTEWVASTRRAVNGATYSICYRNDASRELLQQAIAQQKEIAANKDKADYQFSPIIYGLPSADSCGAVTVKDSRSTSEKVAEQKMLEFEGLFGNTQAEPVQQKLTFAIVGLSPARVGFDNLGLEAFVSAFVGMNIPQANMIPRDLYEKMPIDAQFGDILTQKPSTNQEKYEATFNQQFLVSFANIDSARAYIEQQGCDMEQMFMEGGCPEDKPMMLAAFGTNYMAVNEAVRYGRPALLVVLALVGTVAGIIIMAMMGRVMADSRRETAVFRAIGARSSDIVKIYVLYALAVAARIALFAGLLGAGMALVLEILHATRASHYAQSAFGVFDASIGFHFIGLNWYIFAVVGGIIVLGLVGVSLPLLRNIRRNPIKDMRDE